MKRYKKNITQFILVLTIGLLTLISFNIYRLAQSLSSLTETFQSKIEEPHAREPSHFIKPSVKNIAISPKEDILAKKASEEYLIYEQGDGSYEAIEETINRLKADVVVTGTLVTLPGKESALFRIEGNISVIRPASNLFFKQNLHISFDTRQQFFFSKQDNSSHYLGSAYMNPDPGSIFIGFLV